MKQFEVVIERRDYHRLLIDADDYEQAVAKATESMNSGDWGRKVDSQVSIAFVDEANIQGDLL